MYKIKFDVPGHLAKTLPIEVVGKHDNGWTVDAEIHTDYYSWVNYFQAKHENGDWVKGDFEKEICASSKEAYDAFVAIWPPDDWDYWDI